MRLASATAKGREAEQATKTRLTEAEFEEDSPIRLYEWLLMTSRQVSGDPKEDSFRVGTKELAPATTSGLYTPSSRKTARAFV